MSSPGRQARPRLDATLGDRETNMKRRDCSAAFSLLACLSMISIAFTLWSGNPPWAPFRIGPLLPWLPWMVSPYLALAGMIRFSITSRAASGVSIVGAVVICCLNVLLMGHAYHTQNHSGELWLAVPLYELLACIPLLIVVLVLKKTTTHGTPNQAL